MHEFTIGPYAFSDLKMLASLFHHTIREIKSEAYGEAELLAWSSCEEDESYWQKRLEGQHCLVAKQSISQELLGFISFHHDGYIDLFYVATKFQKGGIGQELLACAEACMYTFNPLPLRFYVQASFLSKKLFEKNGYVLRETLYIEKNSTLLLSFSMEKML